MLPYITPFEFEAEANTGDNVQINCYVSRGDLPLTIQWFLNNKRINKALDISTISIGTRTNLLTIPSVHAEHTGKYTCSAENLAGEYQHSADLFVNGKSSAGKSLY